MYCVESTENTEKFKETKYRIPLLRDICVCCKMMSQ